MELIEKFGIDARTLIAQAINFLIVLIVLYKFAFKPVLRLLDERAKKIQMSLKHAQDIERKMQELDAIQERMMREVQQKSQELLKKTQEKSDQERQFIVSQAKGEVKEIIEKAQKEIQNTRKKLIEESREDLVAIVTEALSKILPQKIDKTAERKMIEGIVASVAHERTRQL